MMTSIVHVCLTPPLLHICPVHRGRHERVPQTPSRHTTLTRVGNLRVRPLKPIHATRRHTPSQPHPHASTPHPLHTSHSSAVRGRLQTEATGAHHGRGRCEEPSEDIAGTCALLGAPSCAARSPSDPPPIRDTTTRLAAATASPGATAPILQLFVCTNMGTLVLDAPPSATTAAVKCAAPHQDGDSATSAAAPARRRRLACGVRPA